jgi:hypothetical protein
MQLDFDDVLRPLNSRPSTGKTGFKCACGAGAFCIISWFAATATQTGKILCSTGSISAGSRTISFLPADQIAPERLAANRT